MTYYTITVQRVNAYQHTAQNYQRLYSNSFDDFEEGLDSDKTFVESDKAYMTYCLEYASFYQSQVFHTHDELAKIAKTLTELTSELTYYYETEKQWEVKERLMKYYLDVESPKKNFLSNYDTLGRTDSAYNILWDKIKKREVEIHQMRTKIIEDIDSLLN